MKLKNFLDVIDKVITLVKLIAQVAGDIIDDGKINGSNKKDDDEEQ